MLTLLLICFWIFWTKCSPNYFWRRGGGGHYIRLFSAHSFAPFSSDCECSPPHLIVQYSHEPITVMGSWHSRILKLHPKGAKRGKWKTSELKIGITENRNEGEKDENYHGVSRIFQETRGGKDVMILKKEMTLLRSIFFSFLNEFLLTRNLTGFYATLPTSFQNCAREVP